MSRQSLLYKHAELQKIICFLLLVPFVAESYESFARPFRPNSVKYARPRHKGVPEEAEAEQTYPDYPELLLPGFLVYRTPFYLSPAISLVQNSKYFLRNHNGALIPSKNTKSRPFERHKKELDGLQSVPYHRPFSKYFNLRPGYVADDQENLLPRVYGVNLDFDQEHSQPESSNLPFIKQNNDFHQPEYLTDTISSNNIQCILGENGNRRCFGDKFYTYDDMPKNHKPSKLRQVPYHVPFSKPRFLKAGYLDDSYKDDVTKESLDLSENRGISYYGDYVNYRLNNDFAGKFHKKENHKQHSSFRLNNAEKLQSIPYHSPFSKPKILKAGYLDDTHQIVVIVKKTTSAVVTKQIHV